MAQVSRGIGWSQESNLLYQILKQLNKLTSIMFGLKPKYKVYSALLTQNRGDDPLEEHGDGNLTKGVTYTILENNQPVDLKLFGAPDNNVGTSFCATLTGPINGDGPDSVILSYNTGAPVVTVLENTIGDVWFTYDGNGSYIMNSNGLLPSYSTWGIADSLFDGSTAVIQPVLIDTRGFGPDQLYIRTQGGDFNGDSLLNNTPIEIRVYN